MFSAHEYLFLEDDKDEYPVDYEEMYEDLNVPDEISLSELAASSSRMRPLHEKIQEIRDGSCDSGNNNFVHNSSGVKFIFPHTR